MGAAGRGAPPAGNQLAGVTQWLVSASGEPGRSFSITTSKLRMNMMTAPSSFFTGTTSTRHRKQLPAGSGAQGPAGCHRHRRGN